MRMAEEENIPLEGVSEQEGGETRKEQRGLLGSIQNDTERTIYANVQQMEKNKRQDNK